MGKPVLMLMHFVMIMLHYQRTVRMLLAWNISRAVIEREPSLCSTPCSRTRAESLHHVMRRLSGSSTRQGSPRACGCDATTACGCNATGSCGFSATTSLIKLFVY